VEATVVYVTADL